MEGNETRPVFVYGTLRRGFCNHHLLRRGTFVGAGETVPRLVMHVAGGIPFASDAEAAYPVRGEAYAVDPVTLAELDRLEDHPHWYVRTPIDIRLDDGRFLAAEIYLCRRPQGIRAATGDFAALAF
jgi:gamma-glutamylcyclotransferase (GGCT)/AIG2-like uncharacterized protein YtfP